MNARMNRFTSGLYGWWRELIGALVVLVSRIAIAPHTFWEHDELLFAHALRDFDPLRFHPHPPGYPLYVLLGKFVNLFLGDAFRSLVSISIVFAVIGFLALARLFRRLIDDADLAVAAALIVYFSAAMLIHSVLPMSDGPAFALVALTLLAIADVGTGQHERAAILTGVAASCAIGVRPQLLVPLLPALLIALWQMRTRRERIASVIAFAFISLLWFLPLLDAAGGLNPLMTWELKQFDYVATHDAAASRGMLSPLGVATRFLIHPWGSKYVTLPLLFFFAFGVFDFVRRRNRLMLPLVVFTLVQLAFELRSMDPADAARYSIPALPLFALIVACGLGVIRQSAQLRMIPWLGTALLAGLSIWYVSPIVKARTTTPSPPAAAAEYANRNLAPNTVVLYEWSVRPHADYLLAKFHPMQLEAGLREYYDRPDVPLVVFANGGSRSPEAKVFAWPANDAYGKLTRNFYRVVTLDPVPPAKRYLPIRGVYQLERTNEGEEWRWLASDAVIRLPRQHGASASLTLKLSPDTPYASNDVTLFVNGVPAGKGVATKDSTTLISVALPPGNVDIRIASAQSFAPAAVLHNQDPRTLATQLVGIQ
jgi:hypothetical protein